MDKKNDNILDNFLKEKDEHNFVLYVPEIIHTNWKINEKGRVLLILETNNPITKISAWLFIINFNLFAKIISQNNI